MDPAEADDAGFRAYRLDSIQASNETAFRFVAALVLGFNAWDWYVDPDNALAALVVRAVGAAIIVGSGFVPRRWPRPELAPWIAKFRLLVSAGTIAIALALLQRGFLVGLSGLVIAMLGAAYSAVDRRDVAWLFGPPVLLSLVVMAAAHVERFVFVNATCFLVLTAVVGWLLARVQEQTYRRAHALEQALLRESRVDPLTGVLNRRALEEQGTGLLGLCQRHGQPFALLMVDIDHFKHINDRYGHPCGDKVLRAVADHCQAQVRGADRFGRWGGEEFLVLLPETAPNEAIALAERIRAAVAEATFELDGDVQRVTVSVGVAAEEATGPANIPLLWSAVVKAADEAMYRAKAGGRNKVSV